MIFEMSQRAEVGLQGVFGLDRRLPRCPEGGNERLLLGDNLPRNGDALREQNEFWPLPRHPFGRRKARAAMPADRASRLGKIGEMSPVPDLGTASTTAA